MNKFDKIVNPDGTVTHLTEEEYKAHISNTLGGFKGAFVVENGTRPPTEQEIANSIVLLSMSQTKIKNDLIGALKDLEIWKKRALKAEESYSNFANAFHSNKKSLWLDLNAAPYNTDVLILITDYIDWNCAVAELIIGKDGYAKWIPSGGVCAVAEDPYIDDRMKIVGWMPLPPEEMEL